MAPRSVFVTGASRGIAIGLEFVKQLLAQKTPPKFLFAACRDPSTAKELQELAKHNDCLKIVKLDVTKDSDIDAAFEQTKNLLAEEGLNLLINNAAILDRSDGGFLEMLTRQKMQAHFDTNATGPVLITQKFLPLLKKAAEVSTAQAMSYERAAVINISSSWSSIDLALKSNGNAYPYRASKAALNMVTALMSVELKPAGILVVALHPGWVQTDMGGANAELGVEDSVASCWSTITSLSEQSTGFLYSYGGDIIPW